MNKSSIGICLAAALFLASCSSVFHTDENGVLVLSGLRLSDARSLAVGWPADALPVFSSYTIRISAPDMVTLEVIVRDPAETVRIKVPHGDARFVELTAIPNWPATAAKYPSVPATTLVKSFFASATSDLPPRVTTNLTLTLAVGETKLLLPEMRFTSPSVLMVADALGGSVGSTYDYPELSSPSSFKFDSHGRLFISGFNGPSQTDLISAYMSLELAPTRQLVPFNTPHEITLDAKNNRLYSYYDGDGAILRYFPLEEPSPAEVQVDQPLGYSFAVGSIASDQDGYVYVVLTDLISSSNFLGKLRILPPVGAIAQSELIALASLESLGFGYTDDPLYAPAWRPFTMTDMAYRDGTLVLFGSDNHADMSVAANARSRGKIIGMNARTFSKSWESGWCGGGNNYPIDSAKQVYGPGRVVGLGIGSLFFIDEGFTWDGITTSAASNVYLDIDRIMEIDAGTGTVKAAGLSGGSKFFTGYSSIAVNW